MWQLWIIWKAQLKPHNLLIIVSDQHDPRYMGCAGDPLVLTPHLDALAERGTRFTNAYTPSPICVPARAALATGRYVHETGYWDNACAYEGRWTSWHQRLALANVQAESIGKLHFRNGNDPTGFAREHEPLHIHDGIGLVWGSVRDPLPLARGRSPIFDELGEGESSYNKYDMRVTALAKSWLQEAAGGDAARPWVLFVGLVAPHMPYVVPKKFLDMYPLSAIPSPKLHPDTGYLRHPWVDRMARHWDHDAQLKDDEHRRLVKACYFGLISFMDEQVGQILATLDTTGLSDSTTVLYTSDHGDNLGARGMWNKSTLYRESTNVPMILAGPRTPGSCVRTTPVSLVDVYPTVLDAAGIDLVPEESVMPGASLFDLAELADDDERIVLSEYHAVGSESAAFMVADGHYKYHSYVGYKPELFDIRADPQETCDLASLPAYESQCLKYEQILNSILDPLAVDRQAKREQNALVARFGGAEKALCMGNPGPTPMAKKFQ